jgi:hypothetical protein
MRHSRSSPALLPLMRSSRRGTVKQLAHWQSSCGAKRGAYVWSAQVAQARRNGVSEAVIDVLRAKGDPAGLPTDEREIVAYVRQLMRTNKVEQAAFDALARRHGAQWMVEMTAAASYFAMLCGVVNAFEVQPPPDGDKLPA